MSISSEAVENRVIIFYVAHTQLAVYLYLITT